MLHRRMFLAAAGSSLALFGSSAPFAQGAGVRRRSVRGMSANDPDLAAMRRAVAAMKALPQSDPRNWIRFADIHRNFCPHGNWYFLPWHRAYIASFERICQELSGKRDFALPYWNWTVDRQFPAAFAAGDRSSNPLFHPRSGLAQLRLAEDMVGQAVISRVMNSPDFEAFGSTRPRGQNSAAATWQRRLGSKTEREFNPHDGVHQAIGGNMSVVDLSARDPIFFLHHANVDRLWTAWNRRGNANSSEPIWRDFAFNGNFLNADGSRWNVAVGELGSPATLGYRYDDDDGPFAADLVRPTGDLMTEKLSAYRRLDSQAAVSAGAGLRRLELPTGGAIYAAAAENEQIASRDRPLSISLPLGRPLGDIVGAQAFAMRPDAKKYRRYVWAVLRDIEQPLDVTTRVRVFANCHDLSPRTRLDHPSYTTSLSFFGSEHANHYAADDRSTAGVDVCRPDADARPHGLFGESALRPVDRSAAAALFQQRKQRQQHPSAAGGSGDPMSSIAQEVTHQPAKAQAMPKRYFSPRRVLLCALPLLVLVLWILAFAGLASAGGTATADQPARMAVQVPSSVKSSSVVMLEMSIAVTRKAPAGQLGAVVRLRPSGGAAVEVGRVSIPGGSQSFQFNVSHALGQGTAGSAEVEVSVIDRGGGAPPSGAALSIGRAQIVTR